MKKFWLQLITYIKKNRWEVIGLLVLVIGGGILRFWNFSDSLMFQGDQGRDAMVVAKIFQEFDPVFIGPVTSVGNMYLGPLYYYLMLPFLWASYPSPIGPAVMVALLSLATIVLVYYLGKKMVGAKAAWLAAVFYTFSWIVIEYSRFSWNPNVAPFFMILLVFFLWKAVRKHHNYWIGVLAMVGCLMQLHYVNLLAAGAAGLMWLMSMIEIWQTTKKGQERKKNFSQIISRTAIGIGVVVLMMTPLFLFDLKHDGLNSKALLGLFTNEGAFGAKDLSDQKKAEETISLGDLGVNLGERSKLVVGELGLAENDYTWISIGLAVAVIGYLIWLLVRAEKRSSEKTWLQKGLLPIMMLSLLGVAILGLVFYQREVYFHYILFATIPVFLSLGMILADLWEKKIWGKILVVIYLVAFMSLNFSQYDYKDHGTTITDMAIIAAAIDEVMQGTKYNVIALSASDDYYAQNYRYFLNTYENKPLGLEEIGQTEKLVFINESGDEDFDWRGSPIYEIVVFQGQEITKSFQPIPGGPYVQILEK